MSHPTRSHPTRSGISLLEVLAAIGVLSIGLLGLAALLPLGRYTLAEALKADRAGTIGRAAIRDIIVRRMLDPVNWTSNPGNSLSFLIDPEGVTNNMGLVFASTAANGSYTTTVPRIGLGTPTVNSSGVPIPYGANGAAYTNTVPTLSGATMTEADAVFQATDDITGPLPEENKTLQAPYTLDPHGRPLNFATTGGTPGAMDHNGDYTWFATVTPQPNNPTRFTVSVVICYKRNRTPVGERAVIVSAFTDTQMINGNTVAMGGGGVIMATSPTPGATTNPSRPVNDVSGYPAAGLNNDTPNSVANIQLKENNWVALVGKGGICRWYRVASIGDFEPGDNYQLLTLSGPDWTPITYDTDKLVAVGQEVVGVYTTTVELDTDPLWKN